MVNPDGYSSVHGIIEFDNVPETVAAEFSVQFTNGVAAIGRAGKRSDFKKAGKFDVTGNITRMMVDAKFLKYMLSDSSTTGAAFDLIPATAATGADAVINATDPLKPGAVSKLRYTQVTGPTTAGGSVTVIGKDASDQKIVDVIEIPNGFAALATKDFKLFFNKVDEVVFSGGLNGGTGKVSSLAGVAAVPLGKKVKKFNLIGSVVDGGESITITINNAWLTSGEFAWTNPDTIMADKLTYVMEDADADLLIE
jgi:hypothetical protein